MKISTRKDIVKLTVIEIPSFPFDLFLNLCPLLPLPFSSFFTSSHIPSLFFVLLSLTASSTSPYILFMILLFTEGHRSAMRNIEEVLTFSEQEDNARITSLNSPKGITDALKEFILTAQVRTSFS